MMMLASFLGLAFAAGPSGHYVGTKTVMFNHIKVDMQTGDEAGFFSLKLTGAPSGDVNCPKEAYTLDGSDLTMPNLKTAGDCAHDQFKAAKLNFEGATYDEAADTITVKAKYLFVNVVITCKKAAAVELAAAVPTGHYMGTKNVLGNHIKVEMRTNDAGTFQLSVSGAPSGDVNCPNEAYTVSGTDLSMPNYGTAGDCATDQFKKAHLTFKGATYDAAANTVTVKAKYLFISVTVVCQHQASELALAAPEGHYFGTKRVLGYHISVDMQTADAGFFSLAVKGAPSGDVNCPKEAYTFSADGLTMPNYGTAGDCATDQFKKASLKFKSATYDAATDTITMKAKWKFVSVTIKASKQSTIESQAPLQRILNRIANQN